MVNVNKKSYIHYKPSRVSKTTILEAIREQRKSTVGLGWVVLGVIREGVEPTAVIVNDKLASKYYEPKEYDVLARVENYDRFLDMHRFTRQDQLVEHVNNLVVKWEEVRRKEVADKRLTN